VTDDETLNIQATQYHQWQAEKPTQNNQPQENGIVETITCTNFMCHDYLQVDVGPLINFIIGHNGSGKSAILTALTVCLGGKASATNRAGSLKAFVKAGKEYVSI
jgi:recombinational DNA repair ATPase RecF